MSKLGVKIDEVFIAEIVKTHESHTPHLDVEESVNFINKIRYALREVIEEHDAQLLKLKDEAFALANSISHIR